MFSISNPAFHRARGARHLLATEIPSVYALGRRKMTRSHRVTLNFQGVWCHCSSAVEQRFRKPPVASSIPAIGSKLLIYKSLRSFPGDSNLYTTGEPYNCKPTIGIESRRPTSKVRTPNAQQLI